MTYPISPYDCWLNRTNGGQDLEKDLTVCDYCNVLFYDKTGNRICDDCDECRCVQCGKITDDYFEPLCDGCKKDLDPVDLICTEIEKCNHKTMELLADLDREIERLKIIHQDVLDFNEKTKRRKNEKDYNQLY